MGAHYTHRDTDEVVEFIGLASMPEGTVALSRTRAAPGGAES